jgi:hypothetical protein
MQTIDLSLLATVSGGGSGMFSGDLHQRQDVNTNWGGTQTNIGTQIIHNHLPPPVATTRTEYLRQHPEARNYTQKPLRRR